MPYIKVVHNIFQGASHVASNRHMSIRYKSCNYDAKTKEEIHALLEAREFHCWTTACLIPLKVKKKVGNKKPIEINILGNT